MAIPDFQSLMLPLLKLASDGAEHNTNEAIEKLAQQFKLGENDRLDLLPSGKQRKFDNRVSWTKTYLQKANLISKTGKSKFCITERGIDILKTNPPSINVKFLIQFPEFLTSHTTIDDKGNKTNGTDIATQEIIEKTNQTPQEILETTYMGLRQNLADEILERIKKNSPKFFENLVVDLLIAMGYGGSRKDAGQAIGQAGDEGIDGIIKEDKLGLDAIYIQAKRWEGTVGGPLVQGFAGALMEKRLERVFLSQHLLSHNRQETLQPALII